MSDERRNLYRVLHVQPEAPVEIIKASWRTLMSALRAHPDLGGDTARAAQLNNAYEVLSDPVRRQAYDRTLQAPVRGTAAPPAASVDIRGWLAARRCPFCATPFTRRLPDTRCAACDSPLHPAPASDGAGAELLGRRGGPRYPRDLGLVLHVPGQPPQPAQLRDLSFTGLSLSTAVRLPPGAVLRVVAPAFDSVAVAVACRSGGAGWRVHARMLTLQLAPAARGVFISAKV